LITTGNQLIGDCNFDSLSNSDADIVNICNYCAILSSDDVDRLKIFLVNESVSENPCSAKFIYGHASLE